MSSSETEKGEVMYSITLIVEVPTLEERLRDIFEPYYKQLDEDMYEDDLIREYEQPIEKNALCSRWYSRTEKRLARCVDNKRHKKSRYDYHKTRA